MDSAPPEPKAETKPAKAEPARPPALLSTLVNLGKIEIAKSFVTPIAGVTGYLVKQHGRYTVLYGAPGGYMIAGAVIGPDGRNLSAQYQKQYAPKPDVSAIVKQADADPSVFTAGKSSTVLYAIEDPNCIFCHKLEKVIEPLIAQGKIEVHYILVGFLKPDSAARAAAILGAEDPYKALVKNTEDFDVRSEEGGYPAGQAPGPKMLATLKRHLDWMGQAGSSGTPTILYRDKTGAWVARAGFPGKAWIEQYIAREDQADAPEASS
ncbi:MAG: thioredoxin fold domain-containing protein [Sinobacteraceae bacterium]|nr:thioredoxin fold domain-containing protein [Nevskiaceae bacterium]